MKPARLAAVGLLLAVTYAAVALTGPEDTGAPGLGAQAGEERYDPLAPGSRGQGYDPLAPSPRGEDAPPSEDRPLYNPADEYMGLPRTQGFRTVYSHCTYCHSAQIIMQQRLTEARWNYLIDWMVEEQGMPEPEPAVRAEILEYLVRHFSPQ